MDSIYYWTGALTTCVVGGLFIIWLAFFLSEKVIRYVVNLTFGYKCILEYARYRKQFLEWKKTQS